MRSPTVPILTALACLTIAPAAPAQARPAPEAVRPLDWSALADETVRTLSDYLKINTTNPPGNEITGARFLAAILEREGIEARIMDSAALGPGRVNLYARMKGDGSKKAIALVQHIDVVPADSRFWTMDPFSGAIADGYIWGRGALDMKGEGIMHLMAMIAIKRSGVPLTRDIVLIANADEELGSTGAMVFVRDHADLLKDVEFLVTEGGFNPVDSTGTLEYYGIGVLEKRTFWQRLSVKGTPSHGSRPTKANPVPRLVAALDRLARYETPIHVTPQVDKHFRDISVRYTGERRRWLANVKVAMRNPRARAWILDNVYWNAYLRNTISLTGLQGSNKTNVIPAEATADVDVRILPDQHPDSVLAELKRVVNDTAVHFTALLAPKPPLASPASSDLFKAVERASLERDPGALVTTEILTGATDRPVYQQLGILTYGLDPFKRPVTENSRGVHGNDERVSVENVRFGVHYVYDILRYIQ